MQESFLIKICLAAAIIGIAGLIISSNYEFSQPKEIPLSKFNNKLIDSQVIVEGTIQKIDSTPEAYFITLKQNNEFINVVAFKEKYSPKSAQIKVLGTVPLYNNQLEIIAKEIEDV